MKTYKTQFLTILAALMAAAVTSPSLAAERQVLSGHVPEAIARLNLKPVGRLPATKRLNMAIGLPLRNTNALNKLMQDMYDPRSPQFRHYLTPEQFTEKFGPTQADYDAVAQFARSHGLEITATHPNRVVLDVAGRVADIEKAFQITLRTYQHPTEARQFYAPDVEPSVDAGLKVLDISGLNNYSIPRPGSHRSSVPSASASGSGSGPGGSFMGKDLRNAYVPGVTLTGTGEMVGLLAFEAFYSGDITTYETMAGLPNVPIKIVLVDGFNGIPETNDSGGTAEASVDVEMAISMAPGMSNLVVFDAGENGVFNDILNKMAATPQVKQFSSSWSDEGQNATSDNIFKQMALQGQSFFQASGDADSCANNVVLQGNSNLGFLWPCDDPYLTSVGGTMLTMNGSGASYASEQVWNLGYDPTGWNGSGFAGSSGGVANNYSIPSWQQGLDLTACLGSTTKRNFPDVAMLANNYVAVENGSSSTGWWGTSFAAPLWAAFTALVNEAAAANGQPSVGFLNPALYALGKSADYTNCFHDITVGNNATPTSGGLYPAVPGYDLCTGWGTPIGSNLIYALALPERLGIAPASNLLLTGPVGGPFNPSTLSYSLTNGNGFSLTNRNPSLDWSAGVDAPWLTVTPTDGTNVAGGPATVISLTPNLLASNLAAGSYTATLYFTNLNDQSVQTREVTLAIVTPPLLTSQPTNQSVLEGMTATFSVDVVSNALLSYQWQLDSGSGLTNLTDGSGISGSATSSLTISNVSPGDAGTYSVIVSNAAGPVTSDGASLTILSGHAPVILSGPSNQVLLPGATATFSVSAAGDVPLSYFWQLGGTNLSNAGNISGSATPTLTIQNATADNSGSYSVLITNNFGAVTSTVAVLSFTNVSTSVAVLEALYSFNSNSVGSLPVGGLIQANNGNFYGTTSEGGSQGMGTVFQMNANDVVSVIYSFPNGSSGSYPTYGSQPFTSLLQGTDGLLYGGTLYGGANGAGTDFRINTNGTGIVAWSFNSGTTGSLPLSPIVQGNNSNFYGTTFTGGTYGDGTFYKLKSGVLTTLYSFTGGKDGSNPDGNLVLGSDGSFYGTAAYGGTNGNWGTIFKITPAGLLTALFSFDKTNGADPVGGLTQDGVGNFYGTTYAGGANGAGTVFKLAADGTFTSLYSFTGGDDGSNCFAGLLMSSDGNLYGAAQSGGAYGFGTIFRISVDGKLTTLANFDGDQGANPDGTLIQGADGNLYGTTAYGGANGGGTVYRLTINSPLQITHQPQPQQAYTGDTVTFSIATFGSLPVSYQWMENGTNLSDGGNISGSSARSLVLTNVSVAEAGLYSVIVSNSYGAVTSARATLGVSSSPPSVISGPQAQTVLAGSTVTFDVEAGGDGPLSFQWQENGTNLVDGGRISGSATATLTLVSVAVSSAGNYSVLVSNAANGVSSAAAMLTVLLPNPPGTRLALSHAFGSDTTPFNPNAGVIEASNGSFYGTTLNGGTGLYGTAFRLTSGGAFSILHAFTNGTDGGTPYAGMTQASDGNFYGASLKGFGASLGTLFEFTSSGIFFSRHTFSGGADGGNPVASLIQGGDGNLYGTASTGGSYSAGTIFSLGTNGLFTPLWSFNSTNGSFPAAPLMQVSNGTFYGTTSAGGSNGFGTVFSFSSNGTFTSLVSFDDTEGAYPSNGLIQAIDGSFYGTASGGGTNGGWGTVFRLTTDGTLTALHSFNYQDGASPVGGLIQATDGNLYGTTSQGGFGGQGTVFQITTNGQITTLVWFCGTNGANPKSSLIQAADGSFYGTAEFGDAGYSGAPDTGGGLVFRLVLPIFARNPFTDAPAFPASLYSASLSTNAIAPTGDLLSFAKVTGPAWLTVSTNGTLSGTPGFSDVGTNIFVVSLADTNGWHSTATLQIAVEINPVITAGLTTSGANILLGWSGQKPPYQVQVTTNLASPVWQDFGPPMTNTTLLVTPSNAAAFYRIQAQ